MGLLLLKGDSYQGRSLVAIESQNFHYYYYFADSFNVIIFLMIINKYKDEAITKTNINYFHDLSLFLFVRYSLIKIAIQSSCFIFCNFLNPTKTFPFLFIQMNEKITELKF